jgi:hypothetical protein
MTTTLFTYTFLCLLTLLAGLILFLLIRKEDKKKEIPAGLNLSEMHRYLINMVEKYYEEQKNNLHNDRYVLELSQKKHLTLQFIAYLELIMDEYKIFYARKK